MGFPIPLLCLFVAAFALYLIKPSWIILLWLISEPLLMPFIVLYSGVTDYEEQLELVWGLWGLFNRLFTLIFLIELFRGHFFSRRIHRLLPSIVAICLYFVIHSLITHFEPKAILKEWLFIFYSILPLLVFLMNKKMWPSLKSMFFTILIVLIVQAVFLPLNLDGIYAYTGRYQEMLLGTTESGLVSGSFIRSNSLADYLAVVYLFITIDFFTRRSVHPIIFTAISVLIIGLITFTGSKLPIIVSLLNLLLCICLFYRKKILELSVVVLLTSIFVVLFVKTDSRLFSENDGLERIVEGVGGIANTNTRRSTLDDSTFGISTQLIDRYFYSSPLVGHGNALIDEDKAYPTTFSMDVPSLISDAAFAFYLVEYGLVGILLFFFFHYEVISFSSFPFLKNKRVIVSALIFLFFILFSVTERGLFNRTNLVFIYAYMFGLARINDEHQLKEQ